MIGRFEFAVWRCLIVWTFRIKTKHVTKVGETFPHLIQKCETLQRHVTGSGHATKFTISDYSESPCMTACPQFF